jgi:hypothetical protein
MKVEDHSIYWFFPFQLAAESASDDAMAAGVRLETLRAASWRPPTENQQHQIDHEGESVAAWEAAEYSLKQDLLPHVPRLLGQPGKDERCELGLSPMKLSDKAMALLGNRKNNVGIPLSASAKRRIRLPLSTEPEGSGRLPEQRWILPFAFESVWLFRFGTGTGILVVEISYGAPEPEAGTRAAALPLLSPEAILEGNHLLGNAARETSLLWRRSYAEKRKAEGFLPGQDFSLTALAATLTEGIATGGPDDFSKARLYSYCAATLGDASPGDLLDYASRLARRYTADYAIDPASCLCFSPFADVIHVGEYEGSASVAESRQPIEFLADYINKVVRPTLFPMLVLAQHEQAFLLHLVETCSTGYLQKNDERERATFLERQRERYLEYRLHYRFDHAARLTPQNGVFHLWRNALRSDAIAADLDSDLKKIAEIELEKHRDRLEQQAASQYRWERIKVAIVSGAGVYLVAERFLETMLPSPALSRASAALAGGLAVALSWRVGRPLEINEKLVEVASSIKK